MVEKQNITLAIGLIALIPIFLDILKLGIVVQLTATMGIFVTIIIFHLADLKKAIGSASDNATYAVRRTRELENTFEVNKQLIDMKADIKHLKSENLKKLVKGVKK